MQEKLARGKEISDAERGQLLRAYAEAKRQEQSTVTEMLGEQKTADSNAETTTIDTDPAKHTDAEQKRIAEFVKSTNNDLKNFFQRVQQNGGKLFERMNLAKASERQIRDAAALLGGNYEGYTNAINSNGAKHILDRHGPQGKKDQSLADLNDAARMEHVLQEYDNVEVARYASGEMDTSAEFRNKDDTPAPMLKYSKKVNGTYYVIEAIPDSKHKKFWVVSAYMEKADDGTQAPDAQSPRNTPMASLASSTSASTTSIPSSNGNSNRNFGETKNADVQAVANDKAIRNEQAEAGKAPLNTPGKTVQTATGYGEYGAQALSRLQQETGMDAVVLERQFQTPYEAGRTGLPRERVNLVSDIQEQAFLAGQQDRVLNMGQNTADNQNRVPLASAAGTQYTNNKNMEGFQNGGKIHLRNGGQWTDSANPGGTVLTVENSTGGNPGGKAQGRFADSEAASLSYGEEVSTASLGIGGGSGRKNIRLVIGGETAAIRKAKEIARERGLRLTLFAGDNLQIRQKDGSWASVRAYIVGDRVFVRVDHPAYTAEQFMRHEAGHDKIDKGEIDPNEVRKRIKKTFGKKKTAYISKLYVEAYNGSGLTAEEIWHEVICDALADMNLFAGDHAEGVVGDFLTETKKAAATPKTDRPRGPPSATDTKVGGKTSTEIFPKDFSSPDYLTERPKRPNRHLSAEEEARRRQKAKDEYGLIDEECDAVDFYVLGKAYEWTRWQREKTEEFFLDYGRYWLGQAHAGFEKHPCHEGRTYRNLVFNAVNSGDSAYDTFLKEYAEGATITLQAFTSASKDPNGYFASGDNVVHLVIDGFSAHDISETFGIWWQQEVVYMPGTKMTVVAVKKANDGYPLIFLQEVAKDDLGRNYENQRSTGMEDRPGQIIEGARHDLGGVQNNGGILRSSDEGRTREIHESVEKRRFTQGRTEDKTGETSVDLEHIDTLKENNPELKKALDELVSRYGAIAPGENAAREANVPKKTADGRKVSQTVRTILEAKATPEAAIPTIEEMVAKGELSYDSLSDKKALEKAEKKFEDGWERTVDSWLGQVRKGKVSKELTAEGWVLYNNAVNKANEAADPQTKKEAMSMAMDILQAMVGHQRNAAQALQATRILKKLTPETRLYGVQRSVASLQRDLNEKYGDEKAPKLTVSQELGEAFLEAQTEEERTSILKEIYRDIGRQLPSRLMDKWNAWRYLAMLGNTRTHVRNILGNALFAPVVAAKNLTATGIEAIVNRVSGGKTDRTKALVGLGKADRGLLKASWNDFAQVQETFSDSSKYADPARMGRKHIEEGRVIFRKGAVTKAAEKISGKTFEHGILEKLRRGNSNLLEKEDAWFSQPHYASALAQYCKANGITAEMLSGQKNTAESGGKTTAINTDPSTHTAAQQRVIEEYQAAVDEELVDFYESATANEKTSYRLKPVSQRAASDVQSLLGRNVSGFRTTFEARQAAHIKKDHGIAGRSDHSMKDSNDVGRMQYVLDHYDTVEDGGTTEAYWEPKANGHSRKARTVVFRKKINGTYFVIEAAPITKAKSMYVVTAYMKKDGASPRLLDAEASQFTSETSNAENVPSSGTPSFKTESPKNGRNIRDGVPPNTIIRNGADSVNSDLTAKLDAARAYAIREALKATYRDTNVLSEYLSKRASEKKWSGKVTNTVMDGILPFRKTPANILARGVEYSPLGLLWGVKQAVWDVRRGNRTAAEAIDSISAGLTGTMLLGLGVWAAAMGLIRGHGGEDEEKKEFEELMGHQAYSLEVGDSSVTLDWLAPEVLPLFVGVNLWEMGRKDELTLSEVMTSIGTVTEPLLEMSCLQSLNDLLESVGGAAASDTAPLVAVLASAATSYVTQGVPTLFGQIERIGERKRMTTYTNKNAFLTTDMQYMLGKVSQKMPWDFQQIPYIDAWGRVEDTGNVVTKVFNNFLNPAYTSEIDTRQMELELLRLYEQTGDDSIFPSRADKYFTVEGQRKDLTAEEYVQYATLKGRYAYELLTNLLASSRYRTMSEAEKVEAIEDAYDMANQQAKAKVSSYEADGWMKNAQEAEKLHRIPVETYITLRRQTLDVEALEDRNGNSITNSKGLQIMQIVYNTPGLTEKQRNALFEYLGVGEKIRHWNRARVNDELAKMRKKAG